MNLLRQKIINFSNFLEEKFPKIINHSKSYRKCRLTVYNLHSTSREHFTEYKNLLEKIDEREKFINPDQIDDFFNKRFQDKSYSLLTLDDGFENNYEFAKEILNELNIKAIFFVIPSFINSDKKDISIRYFESLYPTENINSILKSRFKFLPLSLEKIYEIKKLGHSIGMHGLNHENFAKLSETEIKIKVEEGLAIFKKIKIKIKHFAYPFGDNKSFNKISNKVLKKYFAYIHLGTRGFNFSNRRFKSVQFIKRHPISKHSYDFLYSPITFEEINFFTNNKISLFISLFYNK